MPEDLLPVAEDKEEEPDPQASGLPMISEYAEATFGDNNAIELFNPLPFEVSLRDCSVRVFSDGRETTENVIDLEGVRMSPGGTTLICHSDATVFGDCDISTKLLAYDGNDAITLACNFDSGQRILDVIGGVGEDPGDEGWQAGEASTRDQTLRRACGQPGGDDPFDESQWVAVGPDAFSGFGEHTVCNEDASAECSQGSGVVGSSSSALFQGDDPRFDVLETQVLFDNFTPQTRAILRMEAFRNLLDVRFNADAAHVLAQVALAGPGSVEYFTVRDRYGLEYDAVRYVAGHTTSYSAVVMHDTLELVARSQHGVFLDCEYADCFNGATPRTFYEQVDNVGNPTDEFELVEHRTILAAFEGRSRILRSDSDATLLSAAWEAHHGAPGTSSEIFEQLARQNAGPITYHAIAGPIDDLEGLTFVSNDGIRGLLAVQDSVVPELLTYDDTVITCAPA